MQIWKQSPRGWKKRRTRSLFDLNGTSLRTFISQRRNMRNDNKPLWIVFDSLEIEELAKIGRFLFVAGHEQTHVDHTIARQILQEIVRPLGEIQVMEIAVAIPPKKNPEGKPVRKQIYLTAHIDSME